MKRSAKAMWTLGVTMQLTGCGGSPTASLPTAVVQMTANSPSVIADVCPPTHCGPLAGQLEVLGGVTIREIAGVAVTITRMSTTLRRQSDNVAIAATDATPAVTHLNARGSVDVPIGMHFDAALAERNMKVVVSLEATDENDHRLTALTEIEVIRP